MSSQVSKFVATLSERFWKQGSKKCMLVAKSGKGNIPFFGLGLVWTEGTQGIATTERKVRPSVCARPFTHIHSIPATWDQPDREMRVEYTYIATYILYILSTEDTYPLELRNVSLRRKPAEVFCQLYRCNSFQHCLFIYLHHDITDTHHRRSRI